MLDTDSVEEAREKVEEETRRLPTASWEWENRDEKNELGDLRVFQVLPGEFVLAILRGFGVVCYTKEEVANVLTVNSNESSRTNW